MQNISQQLKRIKHTRLQAYHKNALGYWLVASASILLIAYEWLSYKSFHFVMLDLGLFNRHMYSLARFDFSANPLKGINLLGDHAHIFLLFIAPFYALWQSPVVLLIVQVLAITLSAFPIYLIAKHYFKSGKIAGLWVVIYLSFFGFWSALAYPFHDSPVAVLPIAWALYYLVVDRNYRRLAIWLVILCLVREDMPLVAAMFGVYVALFDKKYTFGSIIVVASTVYFLIVTRLFLPAMGNGTYLYGTNPFGSSLLDIIKATFTQPINVVKEFFIPKEKLKTFIYMLVSFGGLPLLAPKLLILLIPLWMGRTFTTQATRWSVFQHYSASQAPILCVAAIVGLAFVLSYYIKTTKAQSFLLVSALLVIFMSFAVHYQIKQGYFVRLFQKNTYSYDASMQAARAGVGLIPRNASVAAGSSFVQLSSRQDIYNFPFEDYAPKTDYVITSTEFDLWPLGTKEKVREYLASLQVSGDYQSIFDINGTVVLKRNK